MAGELIEVAPNLRVFVRGWLHGNVVLITRGEQAPALIDTGYCTGTAELIETFEAATGQPITALRDILLTHVHSDHAGGCAELQRRYGCRVHASAVCRTLIEAWDERRLWLGRTGQAMEPFTVDAELPLDSVVEFGPSWRVIPLPGHATGGVGLFDESQGLLVAGDALWQDGIGILRPQIDGDAVFEQAEAALDTIEGLNPRVVVPGHGRPFSDVATALAKARRRLARWRDDPQAHRQNLTRTFIAFWLLAHSGEALAAFEAALRDFFEEMIEGAGVPFGPWREQVLAGLERHQLSSVRDGRVFPGQGIRSES